MTDEDVKICQEKFQKVLSSIKPKSVVSDDTFMEKIQSYLTFNGNSCFCYLCCLFRNHRIFF